MAVMGDSWQLIPQSVYKDKDVLQYMQDHYPSFNKDWLLPYEHGKHIQKAKEVAQNALLVTLQPYDALANDSYYNDPSIQYAVNDKVTLNQFTHAVPYRTVVCPQELDTTVASYDYRCVIKTWSSASGDGTRIIEDKRSYEAKKDELCTHDTLIIEELLDISRNLNINCHIDPQRNLTLLWYSEQLTSPQGEYDGNIISREGQLRSSLDTQIQAILEQMGKLLHNKWYVGVFLPDIVQTSDWKRHLIDPNIRLGGSTTAQLLREQIFAENAWSEQIRNGSFHLRWSAKEVLQALDKAWAYVTACCASDIVWTMKGYALLHGKDNKDIQKKRSKLPHFSS